MEDRLPRPAVAHPGDGNREAAFGRARQHSRRVRTLKFVVPAIAIAMAVAFPLYSYMVAPDEVPVATESSAFSDGKLVMSNPKLEGFTKSLLPYAMTAIRAVQDAANEGVIELEGISARLPLNAETTAKVDALNGSYDRAGNTLKLDNEITVTTTDGMVAKLKSAFLDMDKGNMRTEQPVEITRAGSRITSDTMSVEDGGKVMIFEKRVRVSIDPAARKADQKKSGDTNATQ